MAEDRLVSISRYVLEHALGLQEGERALFVGNPEETSRLICDAFFRATMEMGGKPLLLRQTVRGITDMADQAVIEAIATEPEIVFSISTQKIGKDPYGLHIGYVGRNGKQYDHIIDRANDGDQRIRVASSPGIQMETFLRAMQVDYDDLRARGAALKDALAGAEEMRIETPAGTDLTVGMRGRDLFVDDGDLRKPGTHGNLPCGEVFFSPELGTARGRIVFDSILAVGAECIVPSEPLAMEVENGYVTRILPSAHAEAVREMFKKGEQRALAMGKEDYARNTWGVGEVGLGLNPLARMIPDMLEAEKVGGTCHVAIGSNYDQDMGAITHYDMLMTKPRIWIDGSPLQGYEG